MDEVIQTPIQNPTTQPPKTNRLLLLLAGIIILAIGIGIGLVLGKYLPKPKQVTSYEECMKAKGSSVQESNPPTCVTANGLRFKGPTATLTPTSDPTANWKTYVNNKENISFDYPQNWAQREYDKERVVVGDDQTVAVTLFFSIHSPVDLQSPTTDKIVTEWFNYHISSTAQFPDGGKVLSQEFIKVDGFEATKYTLVNNVVSSVEPTYQRTWVFVPNNNRVTLLDNQGADNKLFDQILSTFKFTDETSSAPTSTINPKKLTHFLPQGWKTVVDTNGILQAGYDPGKSSATPGNQNIYFNSIQYPVSAMSVFLKSYDSGSRHQFIYNQLGYTAAMAKSEQMNNYYEKEYQYNGWNCLILYGLSYSARGTTWGMCSVNSSQALFIEGGNQEYTEKFISTIKLTK